MVLNNRLPQLTSDLEQEFSDARLAALETECASLLDKALSDGSAEVLYYFTLVHLLFSLRAFLEAKEPFSPTEYDALVDKAAPPLLNALRLADKLPDPKDIVELLGDLIRSVRQAKDDAISVRTHS